MPSYTNKAINTNEMQKWRNAINPDSISQVTNLINQKANQSDLNTTNDNVNDLTSNLAASAQLKGTTQSLVFNADGTVQKVQHKDSLNNVLREDVFTYTTNLITEVRTLSSGGSITFKYHLDTLQTEVI